MRRWVLALYHMGERHSPRGSGLQLPLHKERSLATTGRPSFSKRQKEQSRIEQRKRKEERREQRKEERTNRPADSTGEDPDIAGIVPGPQPLPYDIDE